MAEPLPYPGLPPCPNPARRPLHEATLGFHVEAFTRAAFGRPVNVHLFRNCAATSLAIEDSARLRIAA